MKFPQLARLLPNWKNAALAVLSAVLLILAFPDFEFRYLAWVGLVPLFIAIERENESVVRAFVLGWLWGLIFFFGTCSWLTFAPITYAGFPWLLAYALMLGVSLTVGLFPGIFTAISSVLLRRFGHRATLAVACVWVFTEFLRYWLTGNNWNAIAYSQAFGGMGTEYASIGGVYVAGFVIVVWNWFVRFVLALLTDLVSGTWHNARLVYTNDAPELVELGKEEEVNGRWHWVGIIVSTVAVVAFFSVTDSLMPAKRNAGEPTASVVAIQPNVPMSGLNEATWRQLRQKHVELAETGLKQLAADHRPPTTVIFPESPMNFLWEEDPEFQQFVSSFANRHDVQVLFNSAEPDGANNKYFNSAVLVGPDGREVAQYDKIYLLPFGESVPAPLQSIVPAFVGSFSYGKEYDLLPLGDAKAGVMICFESHFGELGREYVRNGADVLIEMTNDGYLGPTPVLRQHLANAVFRAVETNRPVLRVTNVGITAYINERGEVQDPAAAYTEDLRVWSVGKSDGSQTLYVKYGDWFAWLCTLVTLVLLVVALRRRPSRSVPRA